MANVDPAVRTYVERALKNNPQLKSGELQERAAKKHAGVAKLSTRQFHARYALQAKKKLTGPHKRSAKRSRPKKRSKPSASSNGDPVRDLLRAQFEDRRAALEAAMDQAFEQSLKADSLAQVNELLATLDEQTRELQRK